MSYSFPGNVRELRNLLERACILTSTPEILWFDLPEVLQRETESESGLPLLNGGSLPEEFHLRSALASWERRIIEQTLTKTGGSKTEAARRLGLSKSDLSYKLSKYSL
jgi:DNA-binding NtrC family response regulator